MKHAMMSIALISAPVTAQTRDLTLSPEIGMSLEGELRECLVADARNLAKGTRAPDTEILRVVIMSRDRCEGPKTAVRNFWMRITQGTNVGGRALMTAVDAGAAHEREVSASAELDIRNAIMAARMGF